MSPQKSISGIDLDKVITSDDVLGKEVIDNTGRFIGITEKVLIDPESLDFVGISVDKGFLKKGLSIGKNFIEKIGEKAVFLNISVSTEIRGIKVFDKDGKKVGKIAGVVLVGSGNDIDAISVSIGIGKKISIPSKMIDKIGYNVILNVSKQDLPDYKDKKEQ